MPSGLRMYLLAATAALIDFIRYSLPGGSWLWNKLDFISLLLVDVVRLFAGRFRANGVDKCERPKIPLQLYE